MVVITEETEHIPNELVIYAFSHCETWLEDYAKSTKTFQHELTERVATLLLSQGQGFSNTMPTLRRKATKAHKLIRKVALAKRTYRKTQRIKPERKLTPRKKYKKYVHWTHKPENAEKFQQSIAKRLKRKAA